MSSCSYNRSVISSHASSPPDAAYMAHAYIICVDMAARNISFLSALGRYARRRAVSESPLLRVSLRLLPLLRSLLSPLLLSLLLWLMWLRRPNTYMVCPCASCLLPRLLSHGSIVVSRYIIRTSMQATIL